jgi:hypothetical protein
MELSFILLIPMNPTAIKKLSKSPIAWQKLLRSESDHQTNSLVQLHGLWAKKKRTARNLSETRKRLWGKP